MTLTTPQSAEPAGAPAHVEPETPLVEMRNVWKRFPGVIANRGVDLQLRAGEVHALLGENGAGKTTLMNILSGTYRQDEGTILIQGKPVQFRSPAQAIEAGIGMVHQHFRLVDKLTAAENVHLGWPETPWNISASLLAERTRRFCDEYGLYVDPDAHIWQLSTGEQQRVEILRVLARGARVLILDEPTAVLTPNEAGELFRVMRQLAADGRAIVFISHKLDEVLEVSDRITVLRHGARVTSLPTSECTQRSLARLMIGQDIVFRDHHKERVEGSPVLELTGAHALNDRALPALIDVSMVLRQGEIVGVAGVAGNGQKELAEVLTGLRPLEKGRIVIAGVDRTNASPTEFVGVGVGHIPEDRIGMGMVPDASITHNAILREYASPPISRGFRINRREAADFARALVQRADVRVPSVLVAIQHLSGGNQQRLISRRETQVASQLLVAVHPTRGLDVGATDEVRRVLVEHRNAGSAVLLISEDLDEILALADRIVVMYEGRIVGEFDEAAADREEIGLLMGGVGG